MVFIVFYIFAKETVINEYEATQQLTFSEQRNIYIYLVLFKDFGMSGIRAGLVCSRNMDVVQALLALTYFHSIPAVLQVRLLYICQTLLKHEGTYSFKIQHKLNSEGDNIHKWLLIDKLTLKVKNRLYNIWIPTNTPIAVEGTPSKFCSKRNLSENIFGVIIDVELKWYKQTKKETGYSETVFGSNKCTNVFSFQLM